MKKDFETSTIEFKSSWRDEYMKIICAFANSEGGELILGVDDKGKPVGLKNAKKLLEDIPNKVKDILGLIPQVRLENKQGKGIIKIKIASSYAPISYKGRFFIRSGSTTQELKGRELTRFLISKSGKGWDEYIEERATMEDIDFDTLDKFRELSKERLPLAYKERDNVKLLEKLNLLENGKLKRAGILLFGKNPKKFYTSAYIKAGKFLTDTNIVSTDDIEGNLFVQVERTLEILKTKYLTSEIVFEGIYRKEKLEYPEEALREAIINAVIHRDYIGAHTQLKIYPDKLMLWNEGKLPDEIKIEDLKKNHLSKPRNELLADIFFKAGLIEAWGRGTVEIVNFCKDYGLPEPEFAEYFGGFMVTFYKDLYVEEILRRKGLNERQIKAVMYVKERGKITNKEYQSLTGASKSTATRELKELVETHFLQRKGTTGKGTFYIFKGLTNGSKDSQTAHKGLKRHKDAKG